MNELRLIGYWKSEDQPKWIDPRNFIDKNWDIKAKLHVVKYLKRGTVFAVTCGSHWCRFRCPKRFAGSTELTDGYYLWPEELSHYVEKHNIRLPDEFVEHIFSNPIKRKVDVHDSKVDDNWWLAQKGWGKSNDESEITYLTPGRDGKVWLFPSNLQPTADIAKFLQVFDVFAPLNYLQIIKLIEKNEKILISPSCYFGDYILLSKKASEYGISLDFEELQV